MIRNLQYDIDNMIKKTKIFDDPEQPQVLTTKAPLNATVKLAKDLLKNQFRIVDPYSAVKITMANQTSIEKPQSSKCEQAVAKMK